MTRLLEFCAHHWLDLVIALAFAITVDVLRIGSFIRSGVRHIKNKMAEVSSERLRKRISKLQTYRDTLKSYSDRAVYLGALLAIVAMLIFMCMAGLVILADTLGVLDGGRVMGACILAYAIGVGMAILRSYALTTDIKTTFGRAIARLDEDISALQRKLANRTQ